MGIERRQHPRVDGEIEANILINGKANASVQVQDVSAGGIAFYYGENIQLGDHVVARLDGGSRLEGDVVRLFDGGFAIELNLSEHKRQRLAETLERARSQGAALDRLNLERRLAARVTGMRHTITCEAAGEQISARIVDMSLTGAAIETDAALALETEVVIGKMRGVVVRKEGNAYGVQFIDAVDGAGDSAARDEPPADQEAGRETTPRRRA